ncbi:MAG: hypothetical protein KAU58_00815, partial [Candidatus Omnitrophica bacterium]|nr:hypothetical protein [Candidatus Omnitrophota bacterium]
GFTTQQFAVTSYHDPDGDNISFSWYKKPAGGSYEEITELQGETSGFVALTEGEYYIKVTFTDDGTPNLSASFEWHVTIVETTTNNPPEIDTTDPATSEVPTIYVTPGGFATQQFAVTSYHDPDGDNISFSWYKKPAGGSYEEITELQGEASGFIALTEGEYYIKVTLIDDGTPSLSASFEWHVTIVETTTNNPPEIDTTDPATSEVPTIYVTPGGFTTQQFAVTSYHDPDGDNISFSWYKKETGGAYQEITELQGQANGTIEFTEGEYYIKVTLTDDGTPNLSASFEWHVTVEAESHEEILEDILEATFPYFWNETDNPHTGFVRDRIAVNPDNRNSAYDEHYDRASIAATGFGLSALCVAAEKYGDGSDPNWPTPPEELEERAELIIDKLLEIQGNQDPLNESTWEVWGRDGFFYHYVDVNDGTRWEGSEVSTIDTTILVAGVLTAGEYFKSIDADIKEKALQVYRNVNWKVFLDTEPTVPNKHTVANPYYNQMYHAWEPDRPSDEEFYGHWDYTSECLLLYLLAIAAPETSQAIPSEVFYSFRREIGKYGQDGKPMVQSWFGSLFVYQYTQTFFKFDNGSGQFLYDLQGVNWWKNSIEATLANKRYCNNNIDEYAGEADLWGLTSGYTSGFSYNVYGAPPAAIDIPSAEVRGADGTVMPAALAGSVPMLPDETMAALNKIKELYDVYGHPIWGDYGFVNSFKLGDTLDDIPFPIAEFYCGIDMGITLVMIENYTSGLIWNKFGDFEIEAGVTLRDKIINEIGFSTDATLGIIIDDIGSTSNFHMGMIDSDHTTYSIEFDLTEVLSMPYLLAIHSFMDKDLGNHTVSVNVSVNGTPLAGNPVIFKYAADANEAGLMKYIDIDNSLLQAGTNTIIFEWQPGSDSWFAWKNIEISTPTANDSWTMSRDETADPKILFGSEYKVDDTYYVGADVSSLEQAINKDVQNFTDIVFYTENSEYGTLTLNILETDRDLPTNVQVFINGLPVPVFDGQLSTGEVYETDGFFLASGWNRITLYSPGIGGGADGEWIRWNSLSFIASTAPTPTAPEEFKGASFGKDEIRLRWSEVDGATKYNVYRSTTQGGLYTKIATVSAPTTTYFDDNQGIGLQNTMSYYYVIRAENRGGIESEDSPEVKVKTGPYQLDYADGHDPNVFNGYTLDNSDTPLGDNAYTEMERYNGKPGKVRKILLDPSQKNVIGLNNANISDATIFSFRIRSDDGGENFQIKLSDGTNEASISLESSAADTWQELHFYIGDTFAGIDLSNVDSLEIIETGGQQVTLYFDEVEFNTVDLGPDRLDIKIRNGINDSLATAVNFGTCSPGTARVLANQYLEIDYVCQSTWGIQIYTDNKSESAYPRFTGTGDRANGLIGTKNSGYRASVLWQVWQDKKGYYDGSETPEFDTTVDDEDRAEFAFVMDKADSDWGDTGYVRNYRTFMNSNGELGAPVPLAPGGGYWPRQGNVGEPLFVYLGADFIGVPAQTYTTNTLTIDIYHE